MQMSSTYSDIIGDAKVAHIFPFARTILMLEDVSSMLLPRKWTIGWRYGTPSDGTVAEGDDRWDKPSVRAQQEFVLIETEELDETVQEVNQFEVEAERHFAKLEKSNTTSHLQSLDIKNVLLKKLEEVSQRLQQLEAKA